MTGTQRSGPTRILTIALSLVGLATLAVAAIAFAQGWNTEAAAPWRTAFFIGGAACALLGLGFALPGGRER